MLPPTLGKVPVPYMSQYLRKLRVGTLQFLPQFMFAFCAVDVKFEPSEPEEPQNHEEEHEEFQPQRTNELETNAGSGGRKKRRRKDLENDHHRADFSIKRELVTSHEDEEETGGDNNVGGYYPLLVGGGLGDDGDAYGGGNGQYQVKGNFLKDLQSDFYKKNLADIDTGTIYP